MAHSDEADETDETAKKQRMAKKLFNQKPKKGVKACIEAGVMEDSAQR